MTCVNCSQPIIFVEGLDSVEWKSMKFHRQCCGCWFDEERRRVQASTFRAEMESVYPWD